MCIYMYIYIYIQVWRGGHDSLRGHTYTFIYMSEGQTKSKWAESKGWVKKNTYMQWVAMISRLLTIISLFCRILSLL